jgi:hypothetical protein
MMRPHDCANTTSTLNAPICCDCYPTDAHSSDSYQSWAGRLSLIERPFSGRSSAKIAPSLDDAANARTMGHRPLMRAALGKHLFEDAFKPSATTLSKFCSCHHATISHFSTH